MAKAEHNARFDKPWEDSFRYYVAIDPDGRLVRIQVKSTSPSRIHNPL